MTDLIARLVLRTGLPPDAVADLDPVMFEALSHGLELRGPDGVR